ncbi:MAG: hypothetical protein ACK4WM_10640 [Thermoflexales bacterium]
MTQPDVAYALLVIGLLMVVLALAVPGTGAVEAVAVVCLTLAVVGLSRSPVNIAGIVLIVAGVVVLLVALWHWRALLRWALACCCCSS